MSTTQGEAGDEAAVRAHVERTWAAWGRGDAATYAGLFATDVDYVTFDGTHVRGRAATEQAHAELFATVLRGTRLRGEITRVRLVSGDVAVVIAVGGALWPWQREIARGRLSLQTYVLVRVADGWTITAFHNTRVQPTPRPGSPGFRLFNAFVSLRLRLAGHRGGPVRPHARSGAGAPQG